MNNSESAKKLRRSTDQRVIAGVCGGLGEYFNVDANLIRIAFAVFTVFAMTGLVLYAVAWLVIPERGAERSVIEGIISSSNQPNTE